MAQVWDLEEKAGSILGGVLALLRERKANPPPPRDARLPPKPAGQTVGSFRRGLQQLPEAIAARLQDRIRRAPAVSACSAQAHLPSTCLCVRLGCRTAFCALRRSCLIGTGPLAKHRPLHAPSKLSMYQSASRVVQGAGDSAPLSRMQGCPWPCSGAWCRLVYC